MRGEYTGNDADVADNISVESDASFLAHISIGDAGYFVQCACVVMGDAV